MEYVNKTKKASEKMATHSGNLKIGELVLPCYVLNDGRRMFSQRGLQKIIGIADAGKRNGRTRIDVFLTNLEEKGIKIRENTTGPWQLVDFKSATGKPKKGYEASILSNLCNSILEARRLNLLTDKNKHIAEKAEVLMCAFAQVGIFALIDEATGYQEDREKSALQKILSLYLTTHKRKWEKTFPTEFFEKLFRLYGISLNEDGRHPIRVGKIVKDIVYCRLAPNIVDKLEELNPTNDKNIRDNKHHQFLTETQGIPELKLHIAKLMAFMDASNGQKDFRYLVDKAFPKYGIPKLF